MTDVDHSVSIARLREVGAQHFDSVHMHYLEALSKRVAVLQGDVKRILDTKLTNALVAFEARLEQARSDANIRVTTATVQYPHAASALQRLLATGDIKGVTRYIATLDVVQPRMSLGDLPKYIEQQSAGHVDGGMDARCELKGIRHFRDTWSKLSVDKQVSKALDQTPKNAGPINSHMLVLRSLALMREISPDYLNRFMSYADALLCLDQVEQTSKPIPKKSGAVKTVRKR